MHISVARIGLCSHTCLQKVKCANLTLVGICYPLVSSFGLKMFHFLVSFISHAVVSMNLLSGILFLLYTDVEVKEMSLIFLIPLFPILYFFLPVLIP